MIPLQSPARGDQDFALPISERQVDLPDTLAECALQLLLKFQEVLMNCNDDLEMLNFDKNDMKVIEQNDTQVEKVYASQQPIRSLPS